MYFIEAIVKAFLKPKKSKIINQEDVEYCHHIFIPLDSSKEYLACSKCGVVIKNPNLKK